MDHLAEPEHEHPEHGDSTALEDEVPYHGLVGGLEPSETENLHLSAFDDRDGAGPDLAQSDRLGGDAQLAESLGLDPSQLGLERTMPSDHVAAGFGIEGPSPDRWGESVQEPSTPSSDFGVSGITPHPAALPHQQVESSVQTAVPLDAAPGAGSGDASGAFLEGRYGEGGTHYSPPDSAATPAQTPEAQVKVAGQAPVPTGSSADTGSVATGAAPDASPGGSDQLQALGQQELSKKQDAQETSQLLEDLTRTEHDINMGIINNIR